MSRSVPGSVRKQVAERAGFRCEYCLLAERVAFYAFHTEHIRSIKHGGTNELTNLAYCCPDCNYHKGSDISTFLPDDETLIRFFNPLIDDIIFCHVSLEKKHFDKNRCHHYSDKCYNDFFMD